jgi:type IV pilus assembly protein PilN
VKLIDINLLPQKETKRTAFTYSLVGTAGLFILLALFMMLSWQNTIADTKKTDEKIEKTKQLIEAQQTKVLGAEAANSIGELNKAVQDMVDYPVKTVPLLNELISLLPERGFIQEFEYSDKTIINLTVQFDSSREAAFYLSRLKTVEWIKEAEILEITTEEVGGSEEEKILPRYSAMYALHFDSDKLAALLSEKGEEE